MIFALLIIWSIIGLITFITIINSTYEFLPQHYSRFFIVTVCCGPISWIIGSCIVLLKLYLRLLEFILTWIKESR